MRPGTRLRGGLCGSVCGCVLFFVGACSLGLVGGRALCLWALVFACACASVCSRVRACLCLGAFPPACRAGVCVRAWGLAGLRAPVRACSRACVFACLRGLPPRAWGPGLPGLGAVLGGLWWGVLSASPSLVSSSFVVAGWQAQGVPCTGMSGDRVLYSQAQPLV